MAQIGDIIGGRYKILEEIGRGGMSIVYLAMDTELKSNWVLKEIQRSASKSKYEKALQEARLMSEFKCRGIPMIVNILEYEGGQLAYIVMEYIPGKSLQDIMISRGTAFSENFVIHAGIAIADILSYLHSSDPQVIHRDIKPANIIYVEKDKSFWLLDFGEAKLLRDNNIRDERRSGTPGFMAPEQESEKFGGRQVSNAKSDLFSLAATLFYMATGQISSKSPVSNHYYSIQDVDGKVSLTLSKIIAKGMEVNPEARYSDVEELKQELLKCTEEAIKKRKAALKNIRRVALILGGSVLMLIGGIGFNIADKLQNDQSYEQLIMTAKTESGDINNKIDNALAAIDLKPTQLEPYDVLRNLYESDYQFTVDEEAKFQAVITPYKDTLKSDEGYSDFAYQVGVMYLIYYTESSESYIKAIDWFSSVDNEYEDAAEVYLRIGQFDRDITKKIDTGNESGEFQQQWESLNEALTLASNQNNDLLLMTICKKTISAMDEYCLKFKKDGITKAEMEAALAEIEGYVSSIIPDTADYTSNGQVDFEKYYLALKEEQNDEAAKLNGTDRLFLDIYPFLSTLPVEIDKTYN